MTRLRGLLQSSVNKCGSDRPLTGQWPRLLLLPSRLSAGELNTSEPETSVTVTLLSVGRWWTVTEVCPVQRTGPEWRATDWREEETDWCTTSPLSLPLLMSPGLPLSRDIPFKALTTQLTYTNKWVKSSEMAVGLQVLAQSNSSLSKWWVPLVSDGDKFDFKPMWWF